MQQEFIEIQKEVKARDEICEMLREEIRRNETRFQVQENMISKDAKCLLDEMTDKEREIDQVSSFAKN